MSDQPDAEATSETAQTVNMIYNCLLRKTRSEFWSFHINWQKERDNYSPITS